MKSKTLLLSLMVFSILVLSSCGNKGDLYHPKDSKKQSQTTLNAK
ncbi:MAG: lipoprotein [Marinicellaceae bacterium]